MILNFFYYYQLMLHSEKINVDKTLFSESVNGWCFTTNQRLASTLVTCMFTRRNSWNKKYLIQYSVT
jgi:hypothetical protein